MNSCIHVLGVCRCIYAARQRRGCLTNENFEFIQTVLFRSVLPQDWEGYTAENVRRAVQEVANSKKLRAVIDELVKTTTFELSDQGNRVDDAFNTRLNQSHDAKKLASQELIKVSLSGC
jgi:hypothetical protein